MPSRRLIDCFMLFDELDMLECRLTELGDIVDHFVLIECGETHQGKPKPSHYLNALGRFKPWADRIEHVWVPELSKRDPQEREREQREHMRTALERLRAGPQDIILQSDLDEIPSPASLISIEGVLREVVQQSNFLAFQQRLFCFAVDWEHPHGWKGPVAARYAHIGSFAEMRDQRGTAPSIPHAGSHMSWLGGPGQTIKKLDAFMHPEIAYQRPDIATGKNLTEGRHVDGIKLMPVDVDSSWPRYVSTRRCPACWFRPR